LARLKRTRNSLLNISKLPPEVLGDIFRRNVTLKDDFEGLEEGSHNFLLVCHHWSEVASRTPEIWSFWGNNPKDWERWYCRSGSAPLDLVLDRETGSPPSDTLYGVLQNRATRDTIRRIHLKGGDSGFLSTIIRRLTAPDEGVRSSSVASFLLWDWVYPSVDVSGFFSRYRFPKLRQLSLRDCTISSWDCLMSRTAVLTTLDLNFTDSSPTPSTSQLLSILASNPTLQKVTLYKRAVPRDHDDKSSSRVQLHHLEELELTGDLQHVMRLLHRLDHPRNMNLLKLTLHNCDITDVSRIIGPYLRDHFQRRNRPQNGLYLSTYSGYGDSIRGDCISFDLGDAGGIDLSTLTWSSKSRFIIIGIMLNTSRRRDILGSAVLDLVAHIPQGDVVHFRRYGPPIAMENTHSQFPNLRTLFYSSASLLNIFPNPSLVGEDKISPSLESVVLDYMFADDGNWTPLTTFLSRRASSGNRLDTLVVNGSSHMCPGVVEDIRGMVRELRTNPLDPLCPSVIRIEP